MSSQRKSHLYGYYRHPRTTAERRANSSKRIEDGIVYYRAKRAPHNLPNTYDDIRFEEQKSWKKRRRTHYHQDKVEYHKVTTHISSYSWRAFTSFGNLLDKLRLLGYYYDWTYTRTHVIIEWWGKDVSKQ